MLEISVSLHLLLVLLSLSPDPAPLCFECVSPVFSPGLTAFHECFPKRFSHNRCLDLFAHGPQGATGY